MGHIVPLVDCAVRESIGSFGRPRIDHLARLGGADLDRGVRLSAGPGQVVDVARPRHQLLPGRVDLADHFQSE